MHWQGSEWGITFMERGPSNFIQLLNVVNKEFATNCTISFVIHVRGRLDYYFL